MNTYETLSRVARLYYPKEKGYCAVIAVALAGKVTFGKARSYLFKEGRKDGKGTPQLWTYKVLNKLGYGIHEYTGSYPKTLATAARVLPKLGTFTIHTRGHISVVQDGVLQDWSANGSRKRVISIQEIKPRRI